MDLSRTLEEWTTFYSAVANVSAALVGLVFVAISIHLGRRPLDDRARVLGAMTSVNLLHPLFAALGMLLPVSIAARGVGLLILAAAGLAGTLVIDRHVMRQPRVGRRLTNAYRYVIPLIAAAILTVSAVGFIVSVRSAVYGPPVFIFLMLIVGTQNAWDLLIGSRDVAVVRSAADGS